jgi:hypothetical protein
VCPDPYGRLYHPGKLRSSWLPPGSYCDYRETHPEIPERLAVVDKPSSARSVLLLVSPMSALLSGWVLVLRRSRRSGEGLPIGALYGRRGIEHSALVRSATPARRSAARAWCCVTGQGVVHDGAG